MTCQRSLVTLLVLLPWLTDAFVLRPINGLLASTKMMHGISVRCLKNRHPLMLLHMTDEASSSSSAGEESSSSPKRRRTRSKRKVEETTTAATKPAVQAAEAAATTIELKPRDDNPVQLQVMNVQDIVSGGAPKSTSSSSTAQTAATASSRAAASPSDESLSSSSSNSSSSADDSLQQLLEDAKLMQLQGDKSDVEEEGSSSVKTTIRNALSTLVTADFFLVCAFLLWFLAGIFCSSVLKDDTVQIAFNSNFQAFVQPALGLLMVGSIAGSFFQEDEEAAGGM